MKLNIFKDLFRGRMDAYGAGKGQCVKQQLTDALLMEHLSGNDTRIGMYPLSPGIENGTASWWIAIDFDDGCLDTAKKAYASLENSGIQAYIEVSKSKGHHVWIFCSEPINAVDLRIVAEHAMQQAQITDYELFPKQDALTQDDTGKWNFGNYINLPLYGPDVKNGRTTFLDHTDSFMPIEDGQIWTFLADVKRASKSEIDDIVAKHSLKPSLKGKVVTKLTTCNVITQKTPALTKTPKNASQQQVKNAAPQPVINIASQPTAGGQIHPVRWSKLSHGVNALNILSFFNIQLHSSKIHNDELIACCPFHTENTASFFLNIPGGYYHCFGCGTKGYITELVEHLTNLTIDQIKETLKGFLPQGTKGNIPMPFAPNLAQKALVQQRYMTEKEIDLLTWYTTGLNIYLLDRYNFKAGQVLKQRPDISPFRDYIINDRGISEEAIEHFKLGANVHALINDGKPRWEQLWYWEQFAVDVSKHLGYQYEDVEATLKELNLINARKNDYWFRPAIIIPYMYDSQVYWAEARTLPQYVDPKVPIRYMGMKGIVRESYWNEDALDGYEELYVVEGAINGITLWCHGIENVLSFGSKNQLTDELVWHLWGKSVILYMDADKNDQDNKVRTEAIARLQEAAASVSYLDLPIGEDINDMHRQTNHDTFMAEIETRTIKVADADEWQPHEVRDRLDKENIISLAEAQEKNYEMMTDIGRNLKYYIGSKILNNMPVGTGKTTAVAAGMNEVPLARKLIAVPQHNLANEYIERLDTDSIVHLYGRTHKVVDCTYKDDAELLCRKGYSVYFKLHYCMGKCEKAATCIHLENAKKAKFAQVLITMHSHIELMDFLMSDYYGNNLRQMIVIDEAPKLVRDVCFTGQDIVDNLYMFRNLTGKLKGKGWLFVEHASKAESMVRVLEGMNKAVEERDEYIASLDVPNLPVFDRHFINTISRIVRVNLSASRIPRFILNELAYALKNGFRFHYDGAHDALFYTWRPNFSIRACTIFLSATTSKEYLEKQLDDEIDVVLGEQFYVQRENLRVIQLLNLSGSRQRLMNTTKKKLSEGDAAYRENLRLTLKLLLKQYPDKRIAIATSLGGKSELNGKKTPEKPLTRAERKGKVIQMLKRYPERSDRWIAEDMSVSHHTVRTYREELESVGQIAHVKKFIGKDGKEYPRGVSSADGFKSAVFIHNKPSSIANKKDDGKADVFWQPTTQASKQYDELDYGWAKVRLIEMLQDVALEYGKTLVPITVEDLEAERQFTTDEIPVLHFGMLGTNLLKDFEILLEINAHYYSPDVIIEDFKTEFGVELRKDKFVKREKVFRTVDKEYIVKVWEYNNPNYPDLTRAVNLYIQNNSMADMEQLEGRILRGEDTFKLIIRLHNVNIKPYPDAVYKSWQMMFKKEFGYAELKGKAKQTYEWLVENANGREFIIREIVDVLGGYRSYYVRILGQLEKMGHVRKTKEGQGRGDESEWKLA